MNKFNIVVLAGSIGKNSKYGETKDGLSHLRFTLMTADYGKKGSKKSYSWHACILWGKLAQKAKDLIQEKTRVVVIGSYHTNRWQKDGAWRSDQQVKIDSIYFVMQEMSDDAIDSAIEGKKLVGEYDDGDVPL